MNDKFPDKRNLNDYKVGWYIWLAVSLYIIVNNSWKWRSLMCGSLEGIEWKTRPAWARTRIVIGHLYNYRLAPALGYSWWFATNKENLLSSVLAGRSTIDLLKFWSVEVWERGWCQSPSFTTPTVEDALFALSRKQRIFGFIIGRFWYRNDCIYRKNSLALRMVSM